jgi:hypothetical protein
MKSMKQDRNFLFILILVVLINSCIRTAKIEKVLPVKDQFFPLNVGNINIYNKMGGLFYHKIIGHDTIRVLNKSVYKDFDVYTLSNDQIYYLKNDSVYYRYFDEENEPVIYFWAAKKYEKKELLIDHHICCRRIEMMPIGDYKIGNKLYTN